MSLVTLNQKRVKIIKHLKRLVNKGLINDYIIPQIQNVQSQNCISITCRTASSGNIMISGNILSNHPSGG